MDKEMHTQHNNNNDLVEIEKKSLSSWFTSGKAKRSQR